MGEDKKITDATLRNLKPGEGKPNILYIGDGLQLWASTNQAGKITKVWVLRYYDADGKRTKARIGTYPDLSLKQAEAQAEILKKDAKGGQNIAQARAQARRVKIEEVQEAQNVKENTFAAVAGMWLEKKSLTWVPGHMKRQRERLQGHLYHAFGNKPINSLTMLDVDAALTPLAKAGKNETGKRACDLIRNVLEYADTLGLLENNAVISRIAKYRREVPQAPLKRHLYAEMSEEETGRLLLLLEESRYRWTLQTSVAVRLAPYVFVRPSELCEAEWAEINLSKAEWFIPASRMKARRDHIVPLSRQALALLEEIRLISSGNRYVFPSWSKQGPLSTNALIQVFRRLGYKSTRTEGTSFVTHGFRGLASTTLYQKLKFPGDYIELQLAHAEPNKVKLAYNQITARSYLTERREMMQVYADWLDGLREKAQ